MHPKRVLNVGGNSKAIALPLQYAGFEHLLLDIDPAGSPDILCDGRELATLDPAQFDAVYCSHNLEHYHRHEVPKVLAGFLHVLREGGFVQLRVPDMAEVMRTVVERGLDIDDVLYEASAGPIRVLDVIYGFSAQIERSGKDFFAHRTGFTRKALLTLVKQAGFSRTLVKTGNFEVDVIAFKGVPDVTSLELFRVATTRTPQAGQEAGQSGRAA